MPRDEARLNTRAKRKMMSASSAAWRVARSIGSCANPRARFRWPATSRSDDALVSEPALREIVDPVIAAPGIEHIGHEHRVVARRDLDAVLSEDEPVIFEIVAELHDARVFEKRLQPRERRASLDLAGREPAGEQAAVLSLGAMGERDVAGAPGAIASEMPMSSACIGSGEEVSVWSATWPASVAAAIQAPSSSRPVTV